NTNVEELGMIDQNFIMNFANISAPNGLFLIVASDHEGGSVPRGQFSPSREIVESLYRFSTIWLCSMTLPTEWICELLSMRLAQEREGTFRFSITAFLNLQQFQMLENSE
ncbi:hypothetical protein PFISCL1PPCAC_10070, partial [Pristionchus fissidentatus]